MVEPRRMSQRGRQTQVAIFQCRSQLQAARAPPKFWSLPMALHHQDNLAIPSRHYAIDSGFSVAVRSAFPRQKYCFTPLYWRFAGLGDTLEWLVAVAESTYLVLCQMTLRSKE